MSSQNGATNENIREFGTDPFGNSSILWKGGNDASSNADGGWNSSYHNIDHKETYRFVVWLKKTNSNNGRTYFGCQQWQSNTTLYSQTILKLDGSVNTSPYFWAGDLPQLNKWYMLVGYVHGMQTVHILALVRDQMHLLQQSLYTPMRLFLLMF